MQPTSESSYIRDDEWFSSTSEPRTLGEGRFIAGLRKRLTALGALGIKPADTQVWMHSDEDGDWLLAHVDVTRGGAIVGTLRVDYDARGLFCALSPSALNWDAELRITRCDVDLGTSDSLVLLHEGIQIEQLSDRAAEWFVARVSQWDANRGAD